MKILFFLTFFLVSGATMAQVGIGTNTPNANSVLDVTSTNKGILLPRVNDTTLVGNPSAGLMIYNRATKTPAFHDGTQWNTVATRTTANTDTDSITYTVTSATSDFVNGTYQLLSVSNGIANAGAASNFQDVAILKMMDINSIGFTRAVSTAAPLAGMVIEIKMFVPGAATPYYSIKLSNLRITGYDISISKTGFGLAEQIGISPVIYGYKDWINNRSFAWNTSNRQIVAY